MKNKIMTELEVALYLLVSFVVGIWVGRFTAVVTQSRDKLLNKKVDSIMDKLDIRFAPFDNVPLDVITELNRGNKIQAIKIYRQHYGVGLKEAKEAVEEMQNL